MGTFTIIYLILGIAILVTELIGVWSKGKFDTISEHWWWIQGKFPIVTRVLLLLFLGWLAIHLTVRQTVEEEIEDKPVVVVEVTTVSP